MELELSAPFSNRIEFKNPYSGFDLAAGFSKQLYTVTLTLTKEKPITFTLLN